MTRDELQLLAEAFWQDDSIRSTGSSRRVLWSEIGDEEQEKFLRYARIVKLLGYNKC